MPEPTPLLWDAHEAGLRRWAAARWGWSEGDPDWPSSLALLAAAEDEGHTALDWNQAAEVFARRFGASDPVPAFTLPGPGLWPPELFSEGWLVRLGAGGADWVQTARNARQTQRLFARLAALAGRGPGTFGPGSTQDDAVLRAGKTGLLILAGGPGTGKTTTLKRLVQAWTGARPSLRAVVAAPTGRAAARARESFADLSPAPDCLTLHRLLGLRPGLGEPWHGPDRPLPFDLVIVDEASMLDLRTAGALTGALGPDTALVLVGDPGQLPSVDAGSVLADLLDHPAFAGSTVRLTRRYRLEAESRTLARVFDLLTGEGDPGEQTDELLRLGTGGAPDFRWIVTEEGADPTRPALTAWGDPRTTRRETLGDRILLSPVHEGPGGTQALGALADRLVRRTPGTFPPGLPWMIRRNLRHLDLSNGDRGLLELRDGKLCFVVADRPDRPVPFALVAEDGEPAWAVTVHKSQGSEFGLVVMTVPPAAARFSRELLYTGLTRAKKAAVLVGPRSAVAATLARRADRWSLFGAGPPAGS